MTVNDWDTGNSDQPAELPSKSQAKREMRDLEVIAESLSELDEQQLSELPASDGFKQGLRELSALPQHEARRRKRLQLARQLLEEKLPELERELQALTPGEAEHTRRLHMAERWRDRLLEEGKTALTAFMNAYPNTDAQHLRHLIRNAKQKKEGDSRVAAQRRLFRHIREQIDRSERNLTDM